jgi:FtsH-binding integral membrane protein
MTQKRWFPIAALALGLFVINVIARLVIRVGFHDDDTAQSRVSMIMFAVIGVTIGVVVFFRAQKERPSKWLPGLLAAVVVAMLLTILVGPLISGDSPFAAGAGNFFSQVWLYLGFSIGGTLLGYWIVTAFGRDYRSRALKAYTTTRQAKPRKVVRR